MKIKRYDVAVDFLKAFFSSGRHDLEVIENAIPEDAEFVRVSVNPNESTPSVVSLFFTSESFPDVPEGTVIPSERVLFRKYYPGVGETP